jgi:hypothetical protein
MMASLQGRAIGTTKARPRVQTSRNAAKSRLAKIRRRVPVVCHARNNPAPAARAIRMEVGNHREEVSDGQVPAVSGERTGSLFLLSADKVKE